MKKFVCLVLFCCSLSAAAIELEDCYLGSGASSRKAECGRLTVSVNREVPEQTIELNVAVVRSDSDKKKPDALLLLAGGPGQSAVESFVPMLGILQNVFKHRDIVLVDQRGTGNSYPLRCELSEDEAAEVMDTQSEAWKTWLGNCRSQIKVDVNHFTTTDAILDLEAVRVALGVPQWNLYGGSYGTRKALTYMQMFSDSVRVAVLDGVVPQSEALSSSHEQNLQSTLRRIFAYCQQDSSCNEAFGDAEQQMWDFLASLEKQPLSLQIAGSHGRFEPFELTREQAVIALRMFSYTPETMGLIPLLVSLAKHQQPENLAYQSQMIWSQLEQGLNNALELSVVCAEDTPFMQPQPARANSLFGNDFYQLSKQRCEIWGSRAVDAAFKQDVVSDIPTLLLSGELDPVTPPAFAEKAAASLSRSTQLVAKGQGHIVAFRGCMPKIMAAFVNDPEQELDTDCMDSFQGLSFFTSLNGPKQ